MKKAILFSGQGAQYPGMFVDLIEKYDYVKKIFSDASDIVGIDLINLSKNGIAEEMSLTQNLQPLILTCDIAAWELLKRNGVSADYFAGYSLGEYAALYASEFLSFIDVMKLIVVRANAMQTAVPVGVGGMAAVIFSDQSVVDNYFERLDKKVWISNKNTKGQYSISGTGEDLESVCEDLKKLGIFVKKVPVSVPFHCVLLKPAADIIKNKLDEIGINEVSIPIVMNFDGKTETNIQEIKDKLYFRSFHTVQWIDTLNFLYSRNVTCFIECGPGHTLTNFTRRMRFENVQVHNVENEESLQRTVYEIMRE